MDYQKPRPYNPGCTDPTWSELSASARLISRQIVFEQRETYVDIDGITITPPEGERMMVAPGGELQGRTPKGIAPFFHVSQVRDVAALDFFEACKHIAAKEYPGYRWIRSDDDFVIFVPAR